MLDHSPTVSIYALCDPRDGRVRYVGKTDNPERRLKHHISTRREKNARGQWLRELHTAGVKPRLVVLQDVATEKWQHAERRWIRRLSARMALLNVHPGGGGAGHADASQDGDPETVGRIVAYFRSPAGQAKMKYTLAVRSFQDREPVIERADILRMIRREFGRFGGHDKAICAAVCQQVDIIAQELSRAAA